MLEIGSIVDGKYRILRVIGQGGMGIVYLAINDRANKRWAIKEIRSGIRGSDTMAQKRFIAELSIMRKLHNPHLPSIVDVIDMKDSFLIVMDYIEGQPLNQRLKEHIRESEAQIVDWGIQLCEVLEYLHGQTPPVVYGDLKPSNIIVQPDDTLVLVDFGAAREYRGRICADDISLGTVGYAAPEQYYEHGVIDARTDIFALGATLYHLYTGHILAVNTYIEGQTGLFGLECIINRCIQKMPDDRYQSCQDLKRELESLRDFGHAEMRRRVYRRRFFRVFLLVAAFCILCTLMFRGIEGIITEMTYDDYIRCARMNSDTEACEKIYMDAMELDSSRIEAYIGLLELYLSDNYYEYAVPLGYTPGYKTEAQKMEERVNQFKGSEYDIAELGYRLGVAVYYYADGTGNKPKSYGYFDSVVSGRLNPYMDASAGKQKRAICLRNIAGYYEQLYDCSRAEDHAVSFRQYWEDMTAVIQDDIVDEDNYKTAFLVYREFLTTIRDRILYFRDSNISREEVVSQIEVVDQHMDDDFLGILATSGTENAVLREYITKEIELIKDIGEQVMDQVDMAYGE